MEKVKNQVNFLQNPDDAVIFKLISDRVKASFTGVSKTKKANTFVWVKFCIYLGMVSYLWFVAWHTPKEFVFIFTYMLAGFLSLLVAFNFSHDAAHNSLFNSKRANRIFFEIVFSAQGANAFFWGMRHVEHHHVFTDINGFDADLDENPLLRLHNSDRLHSWNRWQYLYAPLLYAVYTLYWIFIKDLSYPFQALRSKSIDVKTFVSKFSMMVILKLAYLFVYIGLPLMFSPFSSGVIIAAFLLMHLAMSVFISITFIISHYSDDINYIRQMDDRPLRSWFAHQVDVCIDFHPRSKVANFIFGGFNAHLAHHLFPSVCHVHYPQISCILMEELKGYEVPYKSYSYTIAIRKHFKLLYILGRK